MLQTLNYFVQHYKQSRKEVSTDNDQLYLQRAIDCLKKLRALKMMDNAVMWAPLNVQGDDNNKWAHLPRGYRSYNWVGHCHNGIFVNFDLNNDLCMQAPWDDCGCETQQILSTQCCNTGGGEGWFAGWWGAYWGGGQPFSFSYNAGSYNIGPGDGGARGTFKIDQANNIIRFDKCVDKAIICYNGDFLTDMGNCFVPPGIEDNMIIQHYMDWQEKYFSPDANMNRGADAAYGKYYTAVRDYNSQRNQLSYKIWIDTIRQFTYMGVKA